MSEQEADEAVTGERKEEGRASVSREDAAKAETMKNKANEFFKCTFKLEFVKG